MNRPSHEPEPVQRRRAGARIGLLLLPALLGLVMGWPSLMGRFVGGDDHRLVLDHVLVSRPSLEHALKLFSIQHRDLYQPLPLLTFSLEFAVCNAMEWRADLPWPDGGAWVFHLTNALIHAVNALLVFVLLRRWASRQAVALAAACLFAVHPLNVETVAWVNGRMMLLSTLFLLLSLIVLDRHFVRPSAANAVGTAALATLSLISKVRVGMPLLMLLIPLIRRRRPPRGFWVPWAATLLLTVVFALVNIDATAESDMFEHAREQMGGSRIVRCILALAWYLRHFVWPAGLAAWYEAPAVARWTDPRTLTSLLIVGAATLALAGSLRRSRAGLWGAAMFAIGIGDTLPIVPARNLLAADRYMYLPIVGLVWIAAELVIALTGRLRRAEPARGSPKSSRAWEAATVAPFALAVAALLPVSWKTASHYADMIVKTQRIADVHPDSPWVHERLGWAFFNAGHFEQAIQAGRIEFERHQETSGCEALILIGVSEAASGKVNDGIQTLRQAVAHKPDDPMAQYRLATVLADAGEDDEALDLFRKAMPELPLFNPGLTRAAAFMLQKGLVEEATALYEKVLQNNPYDLNAAFELARMAMQSGQLDGAVSRLTRVLAWAPDFTAARINLGVCLERQGRLDEAVEAYEAALQYDAQAVVAMLNLSRLYEQSGRWPQAQRLIANALTVSGADGVVHAAAHDFYFRTGQPMDAAQLWSTLTVRRSLTADEQVRWACALALGGDLDSAADIAEDLPPEVDAAGVRSVLSAVDAWMEDRPAAAIEAIDRAASSTDPAVALARQTLRDAFLFLLKQDPENPWLYYVYGTLEACDGQRHIAAAALEVFIELCPEPAWREHGKARLEALRAAASDSQR